MVMLLNNLRALERPQALQDVSGGPKKILVGAGCSGSTFLVLERFHPFFEGRGEIVKPPNSVRH